MPKTTYQTYLRAAGRKPIPAYTKLRTVKRPGDRELMPQSSLDQPAVFAH